MYYFKRMADIEGRFYKIWKNMSLNALLSVYERAEFAIWEYPLSNKYTKIWEAMLQAGFPSNLSEAARWVQNSTSAKGYAFIGDGIDVKYLAMTNCDLEKIGHEFSTRPFAIAVQQGSPLKEELDIE